MKKLLQVLIASTLFVTACKKQPVTLSPAPVGATSTSETDLRDSKAKIAGMQMKKSETGLVFDYDLEIKKVAKNKYQAIMKIKGLMLDNKKVQGFDIKDIDGVTLSLNNKKEETVPLAVVLESPEENVITHDKVISFPAFAYADELEFDLLEVTASVTLKKEVLKLHTQTSYQFAGLEFTNASVPVKGGNLLTDENTNVTINGKSTVPKVIIILTDGQANVPGSERSTLVTTNTYFVLPSGITERQEPKVARVKVKEDKGVYGYVTVTIAGDPAQQIKEIYFKPAPIADPKDPKASIELPVMKFTLTHVNEKNGIQRFVSTQTWNELYGKTELKLESLGEGWARISMVSKS